MSVSSHNPETVSTEPSGRLILVEQERRSGPASRTEERRERADFDNSVGLTERESEVLRLVASAMSNEEISRSLWISPNTVKTYIRSAYSRIGVQTRTQAVVWAYDHRLVAPREYGTTGQTG